MAQAGKPPFRGATEYLTFQAILCATPPLYPDAEFGAPARAACEALLCRSVSDRTASLADLQRLPFFQGVDWDNLWTAQGDAVPPVLPAPPQPEGHQDRWAAEEAVAAAAPPRPPPPAQAVPWALLAGESEVRSAAATRKRGRAAQSGRLVLTSGGRLAFVGSEGTLLLLCGCVAAAKLCAVDERHLAMRTEGGEEAIMELEGAQAWVEAAGTGTTTG